MTKALDTAKELNTSLINHPLVIEYKKYASIIKSNSYYKDLDLKLRNMQKEIISNYSEELVNEYKTLKETFLNDDIVSKYLSLKEELNNLNYIFMKKRISQEEYDRLYTELETELKQLESNSSNVKDTKALVTFLNSGWRNIYDNLPRESKRSIWRNIVKEIDATPDKINKVEFL